MYRVNLFYSHRKTPNPHRVNIPDQEFIRLAIFFRTSCTFNLDLLYWYIIEELLINFWHTLSISWYHIILQIRTTNICKFFRRKIFSTGIKVSKLSQSFAIHLWTELRGNRSSRIGRNFIACNILFNWKAQLLSLFICHYSRPSRIFRFRGRSMQADMRKITRVKLVAIIIEHLKYEEEVALLRLSQTLSLVWNTGTNIFVILWKLFRTCPMAWKGKSSVSGYVT